MLQSDIGDIYTGTTFKNGEALVITKDNRYCVINTSGQLLKIDNNIVLSFDEYYAIGQHADKSAKGTKSRIVYDGPTVYSEDDLYGYKQGSAIVLPAQFDDAQPFSRGYAIASKDNKYGLLKLYPGYFQWPFFRRLVKVGGCRNGICGLCGDSAPGLAGSGTGTFLLQRPW